MISVKAYCTPSDRSDIAPRRPKYQTKSEMMVETEAVRSEKERRIAIYMERVENKLGVFDGRPTAPEARPKQRRRQFVCLWCGATCDVPASCANQYCDMACYKAAAAK